MLTTCFENLLYLVKFDETAENCNDNKKIQVCKIWYDEYDVETVL